jgi:hypothetical protein
MFAKRQEKEQQEGALVCSRPMVGEEAGTSGGLGIRSKRPPLLRQESICMSPRKGVPVASSGAFSKPSRDPHTGKGNTNKMWEFGVRVQQIELHLALAVSLST